MDEENIFQINKVYSIGRQDFNQDTESFETLNGTEVSQSVPVDLTESNTILYAGIFLIGIIIGLLVISILTKRWHT